MHPAENRLFPDLVNDPPDPSAGIIVAVPCYNETGVTRLLDSLASCTPPRCGTEVLLIVNAPPHASKTALRNNALTINNVKRWQLENNSVFFRLYLLDTGQPAYRKWGVGMARKTGMDEALSRFLQAGKPEGVIVSLDADCMVEKNYFKAIESELLNRKDRKACSIFFSHPLEGDEYPREIYEAASRYELHLRYFYQGLRYTGFPWVFHTVGSCMAVKALSYQRAGGMNRRQAGEDFYFIQKLVPAGGYFSLNSTTVYPSPRVSDRVPFGTGAAVTEMLEKGEESFLTYNPLAFDDLKKFFSAITNAGDICLDELYRIYSGFPASVREFTGEDEWREKITGIKGNSSTPAAFNKRFFMWFNMFRMVKYLNFVHNRGFYKKLPPADAAETLLKMIGRTDSDNAKRNFTVYFREMEKEIKIIS